MKDLVLGRVDRLTGGYWLTDAQWKKIKQWLEAHDVILSEERPKPRKSKRGQK